MPPPANSPANRTRRPIGSWRARTAYRLCARAWCGTASPWVSSDPGSDDVGAQGLGKRVMALHHMFLAPFLMQMDRPSGAARPEILDLHPQRHAIARKAVGRHFALAGAVRRR